MLDVNYLITLWCVNYSEDRVAISNGKYVREPDEVLIMLMIPSFHIVTKEYICLLITDNFALKK